jgi:opacity protein-like surface antigen
MRSAPYLLAASLALALPASALAQSTAPAVPVPTTASTYGSSYSNEWLASGAIGSNFSQNSDNINVSDDTSIAFGGTIGYMWHGAIGAEFLADFAPSFKTASLLVADDPHMSSYMFNVIAGIPLGSSDQFKPYVSGGLGGVRASADLLTNPLDVNSATVSGNDIRFGGNIGGGAMAFAGPIGFRADVRYFRTSSDEVIVSGIADQFAASLITGLNFWRANIGVAFRW